MTEYRGEQDEAATPIYSSWPYKERGILVLVEEMAGILAKSDYLGKAHSREQRTGRERRRREYNLDADTGRKGQRWNSVWTCPQLDFKPFQLLSNSFLYVLRRVMQHVVSVLYAGLL
jgi:hypothetical protein